MKKNLLISIFYFIIPSLLFGQDAIKKEQLPFGVNLAGAEFGHGTPLPGVVNEHYFYPTNQDLDYWKSRGLTLLRVPVKWERIQHTVGGELTRDDIRQMKLMLSEARKRNLKVILDVHNYGRRKVNDQTYIIGEANLPIHYFAELWGLLAKELEEYRDVIYGYGLMNEPHDMLPLVSWARIAQAAIVEIRKHDTVTPIIVGGNHWSSAYRWTEVSSELKNLYDSSDNLIFEAHIYFDEDGSGVYRRSYEEEKAHEYIGVERLKPFVEWIRENQLKGFVGEYGIPANDPRWLKCLDHMLAYMQEQGINGTYWAAGARWNNYILGVQPKNDYKEDMPQLEVLTKYLWTK